ncbi:MAG: TRAP transporter small permease [Desulfatiglandaceae bacterium]
MGSLDKVAHFVSLNLDRLARIVLFALLGLVVCNVVMRLFGNPIKGTVEWVEFMTAVCMGLSLAYCGIQGGHIAVTFIVDRLPSRFRIAFEGAINLFVLFFLLLVFWRLLIYADRMKQIGQVSLTTGTPYYPFIIIIAVGILGYCLVVIAEIVSALRKLVNK